MPTIEHLSIETREKYSRLLKEKTGEKAIRWLGDKVKYRGLHQWIQKHFGTPKECELCGTTEDRKYHWARKTGTQSRERKDWMRVCVPCHKKYDLNRIKTKTA